jgi:DNA polymerase-3 subunit delta'
MTTQIENLMDAKVLSRFSALIKSKRMAHAYLFVGPKGAGKSNTALAVAKLVNCEDVQERETGGFCGRCASCIKIDSGNHPDILIVDVNEGETIKIAQIRELISHAQLRPYEAAKKVFIIKNIECLTKEGSNALLKTLEEPTSSSLLILTTSVPERCLDTVRSRCHVIHFFSASNDTVSAQLREIYNMESIDSHILAYFSEGCLGKAKSLEAEDFLNKRDDILDNLIFDENNDEYLKTVLADKALTKDMLDVLLFWFRDLILLKTGIDEEHIVCLDRVDDLHELSQRYSFEQLNDIIGQIINTSQLLGANLNVKIPLALLKEKIWVR